MQWAEGPSVTRAGGAARRPLSGSIPRSRSRRYGVGVVVVVVVGGLAGVGSAGGLVTVLGRLVFDPVWIAVTVPAALTVGVPMESPLSDLTQVTWAG